MFLLLWERVAHLWTRSFYGALGFVISLLVGQNMLYGKRILWYWLIVDTNRPCGLVFCPSIDTAGSGRVAIRCEHIRKRYGRTPEQFPPSFVLVVPASRPFCVCSISFLSCLAFRVFFLLPSFVPPIFLLFLTTNCSSTPSTPSHPCWCLYSFSREKQLRR